MSSKDNHQAHPLPARPPVSSHAPPARFNSTGGGAYSSGAVMSGSFVPHVQASAAPAYSTGYTETSYANAYQPYTLPAVSSNAYSVTGYPMASYQVVGQGTQSFGRNGTYDPEEEARIAEWQSAYNPKEDANKKAGQGGSRVITAEAATPDTDGGNSTAADKGKQKTVMRHGGGKTWEDPSLLDWDPLHPRLYVGNLAGEVTDESLFKAFAKYQSVQKARVVRDKKSTKSKGYGFVSFAATDDYFQAAKEMEGKYIGSHPVRVKRANTEIKATTKKDNTRKGPKQKGMGGIAGQLLAANPTMMNGVHKSSKKGSKHSGLKFLG